MENKTKKLVTWKHWVICILATAVGASLSLYREFRATGTVHGSTIVICGIAFSMVVAIIATVFWYANRPEPGEKQ